MPLTAQWQCSLANLHRPSIIAYREAPFSRVILREYLGGQIEFRQIRCSISVAELSITLKALGAAEVMCAFLGPVGNANKCATKRDLFLSC